MAYQQRGLPRVITAAEWNAELRGAMILPGPGTLASAARDMRRWEQEEPDQASWPPYPIVANASGEMARLHIGAEPPEGWTRIGMNVGRTSSFPRVGTHTYTMLHYAMQRAFTP